MAYPDLYKDETKLLEAQNIKVKSVPFTAILTNRRLILVDTRKQKPLPTQEILLSTLKHVETGENAIRDATMTISIVTSTGTTRQMILTFSKTSGGERKRECEEWARSMRQSVSRNMAEPAARPEIPPPAEPEPVETPVITPAPTPPAKIEIVTTPPQKKRIEISRPMKKIIENAPAMPRPVETSSLPTGGTFCNRCGSRVPAESAFCNRCGTPVPREDELEAELRQPLQSAVDAKPPHTPAPPVPQVAVTLPPISRPPAPRQEPPIEHVLDDIDPLFEDPVEPGAPTVPAQTPPVEETTLAPAESAAGSFCNHCGNPMSQESTFCNRCGAPVDHGQAVAAEPLQEKPAEPAVVPQVAVPLPPVFGQAADKKERPIEQVIHSIEPLIEDSVPRTEPAPLVGKPAAFHPPAPEPSAPVAEPAPAPAPETGSVLWPVITPSPTHEPAPSAASAPETPAPAAAASAPGGGSPGRGKLIAVAVLAIVVIAAVAGVFIFANPFGNSGGTSIPPVTTPAVVVPTATATQQVTPAVPATTEVPVTVLTPAATAMTTSVPAVTPAATTAAASFTVPKSGVWIQIQYPGKFSGSVGTPNALRDVSDTGEKVYQISTSTGTAYASVQKLDGSGDALTVSLYKDGELVTKKSTTAPKGNVELQQDLKPAPTPTPTPTPVITPETTATADATPAVNTTASG